MGFRARPPTRQVSLWHEGFVDCVAERKPPGFEAIAEFQLSRRPRRADLLLLRRKDPGRHDHQGRILRGLWPRLATVTLVEFKSPSHGLRRSDLINLGSYGSQYHAQYHDQVGDRGNLTLVLVAPAANQALSYDLACMRCHLQPLGDGYAEVVGAWYTTFVAFTNQVADAEHDDFLRIFSHLDVQSDEARHWLEDWIAMKDTDRDARKRPGYDAMLHKLLRSLPPEQVLKHYKPEERLAGLETEDVLQHYKAEERLAGLKAEERLAGLKAEERLAGLKAEERLAGLSLEEQLLALPDEALRELSDRYVRSLPKRVQRAIRERLAK